MSLSVTATPGDVDVVPMHALFPLFDRLSPMHVLVAEDGTIVHIGSTLAKLIPASLLKNRNFFECFDVRRPNVQPMIRALATSSVRSLRLTLRDGKDINLRGEVLPLPSGGFYLVTLSFGISVAEAVRSYDLSSADFAVTDLAIELLYLLEANTAVMSLSRRLNMRLQGAMAEAQKAAVTDVLTGLYNRRAFSRLQEFYTASEQEFGLLHVDLDHFKHVNDTLGHDVGDAVLRHVADSLRRVTKPEDALIRMGGDEFVLVINNLIDADALTRIAHRLIASIEEPVEMAGQSAKVSASIGGTLSRWYSRVDLHRMLTDADLALYNVKNSGRGNVQIYRPGSPPTSAS